jgi:hypothetical protein
MPLRADTVAGINETLIWEQGDQKVRKKLTQFFKKYPKKSLGKNGQKIYNKAQFENPKHLHQTTSKTLKYLQQTMFWNCLFR